MFCLGNFKNPNHELETMNANMFFSKITLLKNAEVCCKIIDVLKTSNKRFYCP